MVNVMAFPPEIFDVPVMREGKDYRVFYFIINMQEYVKSSMCHKCVTIRERVTTMNVDMSVKKYGKNRSLFVFHFNGL